MFAVSSAFVFALLAVSNVNAQTPPIGGALNIKPRVNGGKCLTAASNSDGAIVTISTCSSDSSQQWTFTGGAVTVFGNKCLDVTDGSTNNGVKLQIWTCGNGNQNQQWWYTGDNHLAWTNHGKCVDLTDGNQNDGNRPQLWDCSGGNTNQLWDASSASSSGGGGGGGSTPPPQQARLITSCTQPNTAALTFDDGPYIYTYDISNALTNAGAKGTFFYNGNNYDCIYNQESMDRIKYVYNAGHQVASHTWSHSDLATLSFDQIHNEMWLVEQALQRILGVTPAFMRPPYGSYNNVVQQVAFSRNQSVVIWDFDSLDSDGATVDESKGLYDQLVQNRPSNVLTLNHETYETTAHQVLPYAIQRLQSAGYNLVTVAECLGMSPYQNVGAAGTPDSSWHC